MTADVVRLITRLNIGGPARQALLLTRALAEDHPTVLAAGTPDVAEGELTDPAVRVRRVGLVRPIRPRADGRALRETRVLLRAEEPRILHTHMAKAGTVGRVAALSLGRRRPRLVHTFHGHVLEGYFHPVLQRSFVAAERQLARRTDRLVAVSPQIRDQLLDLGIGRPEQYCVVSVGLELDRFQSVAGPSPALRRALRVPDGVPLVGIIGRLVPIKAVDRLLRAMHLVRDAHVVVVGDGSERARLEVMASAGGLLGRVHFTGWRHDLPEVLAGLDVVALSSRNEGTPVALIEALAAGRPVVATDVGGVRHVVDDGVTGWVVPPADPDALAGALEEVLADPDAARRRAEAGRTRVLQAFSANRLVADVRALYAELLGS